MVVEEIKGVFCSWNRGCGDWRCLCALRMSGFGADAGVTSALDGVGRCKG